MANARTLLPKLAVALVAVLVGLATLELGYRAWFWGPGALTPGGMNSVRPLGHAGVLQPSDVWELHYELVPELDTAFKLAPFRTNAFGMRGPEATLAKPEGTVRVAFVGDSFTMGSGVRIEDVYHARLEQRWNEAPDGPTYEALNFGVGGYNLVSYRGVIRDRALRFDPDLVVVALSTTDLEKPVQRPDLEPYEPRPLQHPFWTSHLLARLGGSTSGDVRPNAARAGSAGRSQAADARRVYVSDSVRELAELCAAGDVPLALVLLNFKQAKAKRAASEMFAAAAREVGVPYYDTSPLFADLDTDALQIFPDDPHPDAEANRIMARGIGGFLERQGLLPR